LENTPPVRGSGNFLKDRGYSDPTETRICDPDGNSYEITTYDYAEVASHKTRFRE
jgi:hypothetical protein